MFFEQRSIIPSMYPVYRAGMTGCILVSLKYEPAQSSIVVTPVRVSHVPRKRHVGYGMLIVSCTESANRLSHD
jgi:hypothetical protein